MTFEKFYDLPIENSLVYAAWTSSETIIPPAERMRVVPKVGGAYHLFMPGSGDVPSCQGVFYEVFANSRLRYSWKWAGDEEETDITVSFSPTALGSQVTILHQGFQSEKSLKTHAEGWDNFIAGLTEFLQARA
ncbi:Uncharacterized conserved protein YndB, AHSA1/START domain [Shimia gijangensis]|uniref:Uncharacterized conserved protein YndB, AHSA1/START domain n=1 Tax=Shimia gijangensis TaxID=1470563 RepID=A0A1M6QV74_9RHOB|nr:SRPBCC domain-containing protein [Shimia gijangensis]SHK24040.1 Uncharacterized conserved protein YndB, AHSA1/START domain [Shimia gijangensis]